MPAQDEAVGPLSLDRLQEAVNSGHVDTVLVAFTDMQGRLQGKRMHGRYFVDHVVGKGTHACDYLLAVDVDMDPADGYEVASAGRGYGDLVLYPDLSTLRPVPWQPATAMVQCDLTRPDGVAVPQSPRQILKYQAARAEALGFAVLAGTEPQFTVFDTSYEEAAAAGYRDLRPANHYSVSYSILGSGRVEPLLRDIRMAMTSAGLAVESARGEGNLGQHEITFGYADIVRAADQHVVFKTGAKEIAARHGKSLTFMPKLDDRSGNSCHIHMSLRGTDGSIVFTAEDEATAELVGVRTSIFRSFLAGVLSTLREFTLLYAPNINSYKRFRSDPFAPSAVSWGEDNRTCALRVVGQEAGLRVENRVPGADMNPYLGLAAMLAGGLWGVQTGLGLKPPVVGNAHAAAAEADTEPMPRTLAEAAVLFDGSPLARDAFGDLVVDHYVRAAEVELEAFNAAVTDWERVRGFERL